MGITTAQLNIDIDSIFADLADTDADETATLENGSTVDVIRATTLSAQQLSMEGWAKSYKMSVYVKRDGAPDIAIDDLITLADETLRVLNISYGPARIYKRLDLGDSWSDS